VSSEERSSSTGDGDSSFHEKAGERQGFSFIFVVFFPFLYFFFFQIVSLGAKPPLSPPFHPHSLLSDGRSVQVGCT
jgi:hypothetical protein